MTNLAILAAVLASVSSATILKDEASMPKFSVGSALRYFSKAVFTKALLKGDNNQGETEMALRSAHLEDSSDCVKRLLCEIQSKSDLTWDEKLIKDLVPSSIDYDSPTLQFHLAVDLGRKMNGNQCSVVYNRCSFDSGDILELLRQGGTSLTLGTGSDHECTVLFLWNKINNTWYFHMSLYFY